MHELSKSITRRLADSNFINKYFVGKGIDIGGKPDPLSLYLELFSKMEEIKIWDIGDGDAQFMKGVSNESYDFVHSSHCLEHLNDPIEGIKNWFRVVKEGGHLIVTIPDEDLYEQGVFPSTFNKDHKWTFTIYKEQSWSPKSLNLLDVLKELGDGAQILKIELLHSTYRYEIPRYDQTLTPIAECGIEFVIRKKSASCSNMHDKKNLHKFNKNLVPYLNQYKDDVERLKQMNINKPPFNNFKKI